MKKIWIVLVVCLFCLTGCGEMNSTVYQRAINAFGAGDYATASIDFVALGNYKQAPTYANYATGLVYYEQGLFTEAVPYFEKCQNFMLGQTRYWYCKGYQLEQEGDLAQAVNYYALLPEYEDAPQRYQYNLGRIAESGNQLEEAIYRYRTAGQYSDSADRLNNIQYQLYNFAMDCKDAGDYTKALHLFTSLGDYFLSEERAHECKLRMESTSPTVTSTLFQQACYDDAMALLAQGNQEDAYLLFESLGDYEDAQAQAAAIALALGKE